MNKRPLLLAMMLFCIECSLMAVGISQKIIGSRISFTLSYSKPRLNGGIFPKNPIIMPEASIDDHTLYIYGSHPTYNIQLENTDGIVYDATVLCDTYVVNLPEELDGDFVLHLMYGDYSLDGDIQLNKAPAKIGVQPYSFTPNDGEDGSLPFGYYAWMHQPVKKTFHETVALTSGSSFLIKVENPTTNCYAYLFNADNPAIYSTSFSVTKNQNRYVYLQVPSSGNYHMLVRTQQEEQDGGTCNVVVDGVRFDNVEVNYSYLPCELDNQAIYNTFTTAGSCDPVLYLIKGENPGTVVAYNDDYVSTTDYDWGKNARIKQKNAHATSGIVYTYNTKMLPSPLDPRMHIYAGCGEVDSLIYYFCNQDNVGYDDLIYSAPATERYSSLSWALSAWTPIYLDSKFDEYDMSLADCEDLLNKFHYYRTSSPTDCNIMVRYEKVNNDTLFCIASVNTNAKETLMPTVSRDIPHGYAWETKMGSLDRFFHPENALELEEWGDIVCYYKYNRLSGSHDPVLENIEFSNAERHVIDSIVGTLSSSVITSFNNKYNQWKNEYKKSPYDQLSKMKNSSFYQLINQCMKSKNAIYLAYKYLDEGDALPMLLIETISAAKNASLMKEVKDYKAAHAKTAAGISIYRPATSYCILYVKKLLNRDFSLSEDTSSPESLNATYSNDENAFSISSTPNTITVSFELEDEANVTVNVASLTGNIVPNSTQQAKLSAGSYSYTFNVPGSGMYVVNYRVNNSVYTKKISI